MKRLIFWLDTHTMSPLAWPYVIFRTLQYALRPKTPEESSINIREHCLHEEGITEFGLCENCGDILYGP